MSLFTEQEYADIEARVEAAKAASTPEELEALDLATQQFNQLFDIFVEMTPRAQIASLVALNMVVSRALDSAE